MRRVELVLLIGFVAAAIAAGLFGVHGAPGGRDKRLSTRVSGASGARALALALEELGTPVEQRTEALFDLSAVGPLDTTAVLALLGLTATPSATELTGLARYVEAGGRLFSAGGNLLENCFGVAVGIRPPFGDLYDLPLDLPVDLGRIPDATHRLSLVGESLSGSDFQSQTFRAMTKMERTQRARRGPTSTPGRRARDTLGAETSDSVRLGASPETWIFMAGEFPDDCRLQPQVVDTLLTALDSIPIALRLSFSGGGRVTVLADPRYLSNVVLRDSDAGALVIPWLLEDDPSRIVFDEYHHGFGRNRSLWLAAGSWMLRTPGGWAILQLCLAALLALAAAAVRFGPALEVVRRQRRSALEHVDALAAGLERARGRRTAIGLIIEGLMRRSGRVMARRANSTEALTTWLAGMAVTTPKPEARAAGERLALLAREGDSDEAVLEAARTVEMLWKELGR